MARWNGASLVQRSMGPRLIIVGSIGAYDPAQVRFTEHTMMWSKHSRRIVPMSLST
jgi:hypothetical protein